MHLFFHLVISIWMEFYSCPFLFYFDCLAKLSTSLGYGEKNHYWLLLKLFLWLLSNCYWETILTISVKVIYLCKGDFLSSKIVFDNMAHSLQKLITLSKWIKLCNIHSKKRTWSTGTPCLLFQWFNSVAFGWIALHLYSCKWGKQNIRGGTGRF